jgi:hypothetical protein
MFFIWYDDYVRIVGETMPDSEPRSDAARPVSLKQLPGRAFCPTPTIRRGHLQYSKRLWIAVHPSWLN